MFVSKTFPSVVKYEMKGDLAGKVFYGQSEKINTVRINNRDIQLDDADVKATFEGNKATYVMTVKGDSVDAVITAELVAEKNTQISRTIWKTAQPVIRSRQLRFRIRVWFL